MADAALKSVQVEALVVMKLIKHCTSTHPTTATGFLVGMDVNSTLQITNSFPFPTVDAPTNTSTDDHNQHQSNKNDNHAAAAPRAKSNTTYQNEMIKLLREVNVDANGVGWYTSTSMGNFVNLNTIENQFFWQREEGVGAGSRCVGLVFDTARSAVGGLSLRAYRLSEGFVKAYKEGKFTVEAIQKSSLRYQDILVELPLTIHNSHLLTSLLHQIPSQPSTEELTLPSTIKSLRSNPELTLPSLCPNYDTLDLSIDPFLEKTCDLLLDSIETHHTELNNHQYYQRSLAREQAKITAWQTKRKAENGARVAAKQTPLPEDEWVKLFKLPTEPSRLEILLNSRQVEQYARQVDGFTAGVSGKMFAVRSNLLPGESS
ncbi:eukaryotic translation initiation factor 3 subunit H [Tothia fuscella]|uniref:Eukaryotic translation initiation factor 3 subunit H n=1 Tax=Tothia fuscella TaxID=1048955 RepID=A0A9P4NF93_9PEZI|nr:eukaryotic translation initiation factor 3 subunit H [Tothia fuscella]